jgi:hypothetical protein
MVPFSFSILALFDVPQAKNADVIAAIIVKSKYILIKNSLPIL